MRAARSSESWKAWRTRLSLARGEGAGEVDRERAVAEAGDADDGELGVGLGGIDVERGDLGDVERAGAEVGEADGAVGQDAVGDAVEVDAGGVPVGGEALEGDAVLGDALDEAERAGTDGVEAEILAGGRGGLGGDDHAGAVGQHGDERGEGLFEHDADGEGVDDLRPFHGADLVAAEAAREVLVAVEGVFDGCGVERLVVVEADAGADVDEECRGVDLLVAGGQHGDDLLVLVEVEQLVADGGHDEGADVGARQGRVEEIGVVAHADAQRLGVGCRGEGQENGQGFR